MQPSPPPARHHSSSSQARSYEHSTVCNDSTSATAKYSITVYTKADIKGAQMGCLDSEHDSVCGRPQGGHLHSEAGAIHINHMTWSRIGT